MRAIATVVCTACAVALAAVSLPGPRTVARGATRTVRASATTRRTTATAVVDGRFVHPVTIGGLEIDPDPTDQQGAPLGLDLADAETDAGLTDGLETPSVVGFGLVTVTGATMPAGTPPLLDTPAWVAIASTSTAVFSCPAMTVPPSGSQPAPTDEPPVSSVGVYFGAVADGGPGAVVYRSAGALPCGGTAAAGITQAEADVPVAWQPGSPLGPTTTVTYQAPECAELDAVSTSGNVHTDVVTVTVTVRVPFDRARCTAVEPFTTTLPGSAQRPPGAPVPSLPSNVTLAHAALPTDLPPALLEPLLGAS